MGEVKPRARTPGKRRKKIEVGGATPIARPHGSTREGRYFDAVRRALIEHVGGAPSPAQLMLIDRVAWLSVYLGRLNAKIAAGDALAEHAGREYLAWSNTIARTLNVLGLKASAGPTQSLAGYLAARAVAA